MLWLERQINDSKSLFRETVMPEVYSILVYSILEVMDAGWMPDGCWMTARWMLDGCWMTCWMDARWMLDDLLDDC